MCANNSGLNRNESILAMIARDRVALLLDPGTKNVNQRFGNLFFKYDSTWASSNRERYRRGQTYPATFTRPGNPNGSPASSGKNCVRHEIRTRRNVEVSESNS